MEKPYCLWCDRKKPATKAGWIEHSLAQGEITVYFCSKKCLKAASYKGTGGSLDAASSRPIKDKKNAAQ